MRKETAKTILKNEFYMWLGSDLYVLLEEAAPHMLGACRSKPSSTLCCSAVALAADGQSTI